MAVVLPGVETGGFSGFSTRKEEEIYDSLTFSALSLLSNHVAQNTSSVNENRMRQTLESYYL